MPSLTFEVGTTSSQRTFTATQAEEFIPPLLRSHGWTGETEWANMSSGERQAVCDFIVNLLVYEAAKSARRQVTVEGGDAGQQTADVAYLSNVGNLVDKPNVL